MGEPLVLSEFDPSTGIARIVLNRPDVLNAIDIATADAFLQTVRMTVAKEGLRCVLLKGAGRSFCTGGDLKTFSDPVSAVQVIDRILKPMHETMLVLARCPAPIIIAVQGIAAGAGFSLALCGDLVLAAEGPSGAASGRPRHWNFC